MSDADLIATLRPGGWIMLTDEQADEVLALAADRLEALTKLPDDPHRPATWRREAEIREKDRKFGPFDGANVHSVIHDRRDLIALLDHERRTHAEDVAVLTDALVEDGRFDLGRAAGVAQALAVVEKSLGQINDRLLPGRPAFVGAGPQQQRDDTVREDYAEYLLEVIVKECGPAVATPPHLEVVAECERLRAALLAVSEAYKSGTVGSVISAERMCKIAREALGEGGP